MKTAFARMTLFAICVALAGCTVTTGPEPRPVKAMPGAPLLHLESVAETMTGTWAQVHPSSNAFRNALQSALMKKGQHLFTNDVSGLRMRIELVSDHEDDGPRLVGMALVSMGTLGLLPLNYHSEWNVQCNVTIRMADDTVVARLPIHEMGTYDIEVWPPTWFFLIANMPRGPGWFREMQQKTVDALAARISEAVASDYARLAACKRTNALQLAALAGGGAAPPPPPSRPTVTGTSPIARRWAVVIGLSQYKFRGKWGLTDLRYAARDADVLAKFLRSEKGGRFDHVTVLLDENATTRNVKAALREQLRGAQKGDFVLISWSGHGGADPREKDRLYLFSYDADPAHMASTAYSMKELQADIARIEAERVVVLADTCHSAGISDPTVGVRGNTVNPIVKGFRDLEMLSQQKPRVDNAQRAGPMRLIFTSCESGETSLESSKLGGGHGAFTYFLLQALRGEADRRNYGGDGDGRVLLGEVIEFTRDQVKRFTGNQQHPDTAGHFDRGIVMSRTR